MTNETPRLGEKQRKIIELLRDGDKTSRQLRDMTGYGNTVINGSLQRLMAYKIAYNTKVGKSYIYSLACTAMDADDWIPLGQCSNAGEFIDAMELYAKRYEVWAQLALHCEAVV